MGKNNFPILLIAYCSLLILLFLYSFTQIDLNLTISSNSAILRCQEFFQQIGYFQRPLSTVIFIIILIVSYLLYLISYIFVTKNKINFKQIKILIVITTVLLLFSYPAFSYDLFNYLFYGRIITHYGLSPYDFRALDFPFDPWTRFMHWTHNTYPYGPFWLVLTTPLSFLGLQKFIPTLILYKMLMAGGYLLSSYSVYKIAQKIKLPNPLLPLVLFALNPLVIIESLVSAHNDIVMIGMALFALYLLLCQKFIPGLILLVLSILIKFVTLALLPVWLIVLFYKYQKKAISHNKLILISCCLLFAGSCLFIRNNVTQPWYFIWLYPFILLLNNKYLNIISSFFSFGLLLTYSPYLYLGNWDNPVILIKNWIYIISLILGIFVSVVIFFQNNRKKMI